MNAISNLWNGHSGLAKTYWLWGVLSGIPWGIALSLVTPGSHLAILALLASVVYYVIVYVGIWRAASQYQGFKVWAILAKVAVAIIPICLVIGILATIIIPAMHQLSKQGQQTTSATTPLNQPSNPSVSRAFQPCSEGEMRIAGESVCSPSRSSMKEDYLEGYFLPLENIVVDLSDGTYLMIGITFKLYTELDLNYVREKSSENRELIIKLFQKKTSQELMSEEGKEKSAREILSIIKYQTGVTPKKVLFSSFVLNK